MFQTHAFSPLHTHHHPERCVIIIPMLQMRKLRLQEVKWPTWGQTPDFTPFPMYQVKPCQFSFHFCQGHSFEFVLHAEGKRSVSSSQSKKQKGIYRTHCQQWIRAEVSTEATGCRGVERIKHDYNPPFQPCVLEQVMLAPWASISSPVNRLQMMQLNFHSK